MKLSEIDQMVLHEEGQAVAKRALQSNHEAIPEGDLLQSQTVQNTMQQYYQTIEQHLNDTSNEIDPNTIDLDDEATINQYADQQLQQQQWHHDQLIMGQLVDQNMVEADLTFSNQTIVEPLQENGKSIFEHNGPKDETSLFGDGLDDLTNEHRLLR